MFIFSNASKVIGFGISMRYRFIWACWILNMILLISDTFKKKISVVKKFFLFWNSFYFGILPLTFTIIFPIKV